MSLGGKLDGDVTFGYPLLSSAGASAASIEDRVTKLFEELRTPIYRYVVLIVWNPAVAEEITQEAFLRLHRHMSEKRKIENVRAWVMRVAHNLAIDFGRTDRPADSLSLRDVQTVAEAIHSSAADDPEKTMLAQERSQLLYRAVQGLSQRQRQCLDLRFEGFRYIEIAEILAVSESTVIENIRRAMVRLAKEFYVTR